MKRIGEYELVRELGVGAMGEVHLAQHVETGRRVAIKLLKGSHTRGLARFKAEALAVARLQHPNIVKIHSAELEVPEPYLVMSFVDGQSLGERLKRDGPLPRADVLGIGVALADALAHAHGEGILHRDLKPANVLEGRDGRVYLTDFGLARDLASSREALTLSGHIVGTPAFMAPEQAGERGLIGPATDLYGLGATLYALLGGRPPHERENLMAMVAAVVLADPTPLSDLRPDVDPGLEAVIHRCLARAPSQRPASAAALREALARVQRGERGRSGGRFVLLGGLAIAAVAIAWGLRATPAQPPEVVLAPPELPAPGSASATPPPLPILKSELLAWPEGRLRWSCAGVAVGPDRIRVLITPSDFGTPERWTLVGQRWRRTRGRMAGLPLVDSRSGRMGVLGTMGFWEYDARDALVRTQTQVPVSPRWLGGALRPDLTWLRRVEEGDLVTYVRRAGAWTTSSRSLPAGEALGPVAAWLPSLADVVLWTSGSVLVCESLESKVLGRRGSPTAPSRVVCFPRSPKVLVVGGEEGAAVCSLPGLATRSRLGAPTRFLDGVIGPREERAYLVTERSVVVWDLVGGRQLEAREVGQVSSGIALGGEILAIGLRGGLLKITLRTP